MSTIESMTSSMQLDQAALGKDDYLRLLITQLSNQDPLSPMESTDFSGQLAQFSSLEQLCNINDNISESLDIDLLLTQAINNTLATTIIGKAVTGLGNGVVFDNDGAGTVSFRLDSPAANVEISILDAQGEVVRTLKVKDLLAGDHSIEWDGLDENGEAVAEGTYTFELKATDAAGNGLNVESLMIGKVSGVRYDQGRAMLLVGDTEIPFSAVLELGVSDNI